MSETVSQAVEQLPPRMLDETRWADVLPAHIGPARFQRWALGLMQRPDMLEVAKTPVGQLSIVTALLDCATLGLEPGREYHLVKYGQTVKGITDYKGEVKLIWNAVQRPVIASLVYSKDEFVIRGANVPPLHTGDWFAEDGRGDIIGGYAYVDYGGSRELGNGKVAPGGGEGADHLYSQVVYLTEADFIKHRAKAQTKNVWDEWPEAMRLKTLVHQLRKWVPWSAEVRQP